MSYHVSSLCDCLRGESLKHSAGVGQTRGSAGLAIRPLANLARLIAVAVAFEELAALALGLARVHDGAGVAKVGVDAAQGAAVDGLAAGDDDVPGAAVAAAVAAAADDLAVVLCVKVGDLDGPEPVELDDLVRGGEGAAADDAGGAAVLLEGDGVLADVLEPDVLEGAGAAAMDALGLVGADDDVGEGGAVLEDEHGVVLARLGLVLADAGRAVVELHAAVEGAGDDDGLVGELLALGGGEGGLEALGIGDGAQRREGEKSGRLPADGCEESVNGEERMKVLERCKTGKSCGWRQDENSLWVDARTSLYRFQSFYESSRAFGAGIVSAVSDCETLFPMLTLCPC